MSMLSRYKKAGGFNQLLKLIEGFGPQKQDKFLTMIEQENPQWAKTLRDKMINIQKVFSWDGIHIGEVVVRVPELTTATALIALSPEAKEKTFKTLNYAQKKKIEEIMEEKKPSEGELNSAMIRIVNEVRDMITQNILRIEKIDPSLSIDDNIEEQLASGRSTSQKKTSDDSPSNSLDFSSAEPLQDSGSAPQLDFSKAEGMDKSNGENRKLQARLIKLGQENNQLKSENKLLRDKLTQIKKIA